MSETTNLQLKKHDNPSTNTDVFDIENYLNGNWDKIDTAYGNTGADIEDIQENYVKNTDYATSGKAGVIKASGTYGTIGNASSGVLSASIRSYENYQEAVSGSFISKGTLENVITGKDLTTKAYVDSLVGDIESILEELDIGSGV